MIFFFYKIYEFKLGNVIHHKGLTLNINFLHYVNFEWTNFSFLKREKKKSTIKIKFIVGRFT